MDIPTIASFLSNNPLIWPLLVVYLVYVAYFVRRVMATPVRVLPKWLWILVVIFVSPPLSGILFLTSGLRE